MTELREREKNKPASKKEKACLALIAAVLVVIVAALILRPRADGVQDTPVSAADAAEEPKTVVREKIVTVEKAVTVETLQEGLNDMGVLITEEYYFTDLVSYSSVKTLFNFALPFTETSYMVSYDGVVRAGVDLSGASVEKDDERKTVAVRVPKSSIRSIDIDYGSFKLYEEKTGLGNPISVQDYNTSLQALERSAEQKATERRLLEKADENAKLVISQFIASLIDTSEYTVSFTTL